jgi:hypothetical protein
VHSSTVTVIDHLAGQIVYRPLTGQLKQHRQLEESGQGHRIVRPIKRRN